MEKNREGEERGRKGEGGGTGGRGKEQGLGREEAAGLGFLWGKEGRPLCKYHMVHWQDLCAPTNFGGLGFIESRAKNISLLAKWIIKLERGDQDLS